MAKRAQWGAGFGTPASKRAQVSVIDIPRKISSPKEESEYRPDAVYPDVDEGHFLFRTFG